MEPLLMDTLYKGHNKSLHIKDRFNGPKNEELHALTIHFNLQREDNLHIKDKMSGLCSFAIITIYLV